MDPFDRRQAKYNAILLTFDSLLGNLFDVVLGAELHSGSDLLGVDHGIRLNVGLGIHGVLSVFEVLALTSQVQLV